MTGSGEAKHITKVGLAVMEAGKLLLVRKKGSEIFILPGGKPEQGEEEVDTLRREIMEELGCGVLDEGLDYHGAFSDIAAGSTKTTVTVLLYRGSLIGEPAPQAEIEEIRWYSPTDGSDLAIAPSLENLIVPHLYPNYEVQAAR